FAAFSPAGFRLATSLADGILAGDVSLRRPFPGAWTSATFALGPQSVTTPQWLSDAARWAWIAMTALGTFDHETGGHLILWDLGRALEFPPGATILIPAQLRFSIARVNEGETRFSLIQYLA
ncbi:hypothetical protein C8R46DRAFT_821331, partial [Mycena filopes]